MSGFERFLNTLSRHGHDIESGTMMAEPSGVYGWVGRAHDPQSFDSYYHNTAVYQHPLFECEYADSFYCPVCDQHIPKKEAVFRDDNMPVQFR